MVEITNIHVVWLQGQACTGCTVSFTNATHPSLADLLSGFIPQATGVTLDFHQTIMTSWGEQATQILDAAKEGKLAPLVLVVEGVVPDESIASTTGGFYCLAGEEIPQRTDYFSSNLRISITKETAFFTETSTSLASFKLGSKLFGLLPIK